MGCNCEGKPINIGMGCCQPVLAPIENYYTKWQVDKLIENIDVSGVTEEEVDEMISSATSGLASEQWVEDQHYITGVDLSDYALKSEIPTVPTNVSAFVNDVPYLTEHQSLSGYATEAFVSAFTYDKQTIDDKVAQGGSFDPTQYYTKSQVDEKDAERLLISDFQTYSGTVASELSGKASQSTVETLSGDIQTVSAEVQTIISGEVTSADVQTMITQNISGKTNQSDFTAHTSNNDIHVTAADKTSWNAKPNVWVGDETAWSQISGNTQQGVIYLVY